MRAAPFLACGLYLVASVPCMAAAGPPPAAVRTAEVRLQELQQHIRLLGSLQATQRVATAAEESGRLLAVHADLGDRVEPGQLLAEIDGERLVPMVAEAEASLAASQAAIDEAQLLVGRAEADATTLRRAVESRSLSSIDARRADDTLAEARAGLSRRQAEHAAAKARLQALQTRQADLQVVSPFAGTVVARLRDPGAWVASGESILELVSHQLEVRSDIPERYWAAVHQHAERLLVLLDGAQPLGESGPLRIVPEVEASSRTFRVVAALDSALPLAAGLSVEVDLPISASTSVLLIPAPAVIRSGNSHVFVVERGEGGLSGRLQSVQVLFARGADLAVSGPGLEAGMQVIIEGNERLRPGGAITLIETPPEAGR